MRFIRGLIQKKQHLIAVGISGGMGYKPDNTAQHVRTGANPTGEEHCAKSLQWGSSKNMLGWSQPFLVRAGVWF